MTKRLRTTVLNHVLYAHFGDKMTSYANKCLLLEFIFSKSNQRGNAV